MKNAKMEKPSIIANQHTPRKKTVETKANGDKALKVKSENGNSSGRKTGSRKTPEGGSTGKVKDTRKKTTVKSKTNGNKSKGSTAIVTKDSQKANKTGKNKTPVKTSARPISKRRGYSGEQGKGKPRTKQTPTTKPENEKFAWSAFQNSPDPKSLPLPSFITSDDSRNEIRTRSMNINGSKEIEYAAQFLPRNPEFFSELELEAREAEAEKNNISQGSKPANGHIADTEAAQHLKQLLGLTLSKEN